MGRDKNGGREGNKGGRKREGEFGRDKNGAEMGMRGEGRWMGSWEGIRRGAERVMRKREGKEETLKEKKERG